MWQIKFGYSKILNLLIVALFGTLVGIDPADAASHQYTVEVLVFKTAKPATYRGSGGDEIWREDSETALANIIPRKKSASKPPNSKTHPISYTTGSKLAYMLGLLKKNSNYQILKYISWRQPPLNRKRSPKVPFSSRLADDNHLPGELQSGLEGTVRLYRGNYLQLNINLTYSSQSEITLESPNSTTEVQSVAAMETYTIREKRKVRINQINYFDHPMFGVIAVVFPSKKRVTTK